MTKSKKRKTRKFAARFSSKTRKFTANSPSVSGKQSISVATDDTANFVVEKSCSTVVETCLVIMLNLDL